ncbi:hemin-degrading factor [Marinobacter zhejiangensis]|uniref:Putative hemin transport protein n=1 Tax=Marinobacter zhejiangensis TaxID=488535 RepID=A0A1I4TNC2_9GAMM|nr:ChuX/HutX family heme-like substrate-binding protein [Marinobacter zhejiangensis]SFM78264.1 putative hemin transport protein [Marinobacter zhejiangensis]
MEATLDRTQTALVDRWQALLQQQPGLRIRNAAKVLGVSELELLLCRDGASVRSLKPEFGRLLSALDPVGEVMILSRNEEVVHEVTAAFSEFKVAGSGTMGLAVGDIDIRVFFSHWKHAYLVTEDSRVGPRESLQFFDGHGRALHKIYRTKASNAEAWEQLIEAFVAEAPVLPELTPPPAPEARVEAATVDVQALRQDWATLKDTHHFHAMLKRNQVDRLTAVEVVGQPYSQKLQRHSELAESPLDLLLAQVRDSGCPIMVFVGNPGIVQIFTGSVRNLRRTGEWMNVLDPGFNLHANTQGITDWWVVRKPTTDGMVTSVEGYNADGEIVITLFGKRKPGQPESEAWQAEVRALEAALCV